MKIRFYMDKDGDCFTSENIRGSIEDFYWEDICESYLQRCASYDIVSQLFFGGCHMYKDDFLEFEDEYINDRIKEDFKEIVLEITDEDIVE